jgi:hypothetical protein
MVYVAPEKRSEVIRHAFCDMKLLKKREAPFDACKVKLRSWEKEVMCCLGGARK